jgi:hypothetical protein
VFLCKNGTPAAVPRCTHFESFQHQSICVAILLAPRTRGYIFLVWVGWVGGIRSHFYTRAVTGSGCCCVGYVYVYTFYVYGGDRDNSVLRDSNLRPWDKRTMRSHVVTTGLMQIIHRSYGFVMGLCLTDDDVCLFSCTAVAGLAVIRWICCVWGGGRKCTPACRCMCTEPPSPLPSQKKQVHFDTYFYICTHTRRSPPPPLHLE